MTLDEAIKHAEEVADTCEYEASKYDMIDSYESHVACQEGKCAEEHRQLAEWLKELKRLKEQEPTIDKIRAEIEATYMNITYQENKDRKATWGLRKTLQIIDKHKVESEGEE